MLHLWWCVYQINNNNNNNNNYYYYYYYRCWYRHCNLSVIVPVSPYKILYSYVALVPAPSCIWQYKFVHKFAGTLDTAYYYSKIILFMA